VWTVLVVVTTVDAEYVLEMAATEDQDRVETISADPPSTWQERRTYRAGRSGESRRSLRTLPAAVGGEILLSDEAFCRVSSWLADRGLTAEPRKLELKGFDGAQPAHRLRASVPIAAA
jgi:hypothetical protein